MVYHRILYDGRLFWVSSNVFAQLLKDSQYSQTSQYLVKARKNHEIPFHFHKEDVSVDLNLDSKIDFLSNESNSFL